MHSRLLRSAIAALATCMIAGTLAATAGAAGSATATCRGSANLCEATFSLAGGASNKRLTVQIPVTNIRLLGVNATPAYVNGATGSSAAASPPAARSTRSTSTPSTASPPAPS